MNQTPHCCGSWSLAPAGRARRLRQAWRRFRRWLDPHQSPGESITQNSTCVRPGHGPSGSRGGRWASALCPSKGARAHQIWCANRLQEGHSRQGNTSQGVGERPSQGGDAAQAASPSSRSRAIRSASRRRVVALGSSWTSNWARAPRCTTRPMAAGAGGRRRGGRCGPKEHAIGAKALIRLRLVSLKWRALRVACWAARCAARSAPESTR